MDLVAAVDLVPQEDRSTDQERTPIAAHEGVLAGGIEAFCEHAPAPGALGCVVVPVSVVRVPHAGSTSVIVLTARDSAADTLRGLEGGANDYMSKPFRFDELLARVRLRLKDGQTGPVESLHVGGLELDLLTRRISVDGSVHDLSAREFALAEEFMRHPGQVLSHEQLLSRVWGFDFDPGSNVVGVYVRYLRAKVGADRIETVRGMGYRLV
jgi:DNA-binding response OmpR family regulator